MFAVPLDWPGDRGQPPKQSHTPNDNGQLPVDRFMMHEPGRVSKSCLTCIGGCETQVLEGISWMMSESMFVYYMGLFKEAVWPGGKLFVETQERTSQDMLNTKQDARNLLLNHVPEMMSFLGSQNACKGTLKVFEALQNKQLNKQLFYDILEKVLYEFAPELRTE
ncbi:sorting nexin-25-like [Tropilaelaps mercedesae]|uniref:Sorting nexin-25-like n=1 Tax=Tropilaelaps mercedesae TaxID=418985 RepID=A0A1V9XNZ3_9ACAR|nr:sorting nexin-25-like [Tropilaelaps mercedesae]